MIRQKRVFLHVITYLAIVGMVWYAQPAHAQDNTQSRQAAEMNKVYAEHLATGLCKSEYSKRFTAGSLSPTDIKKLNDHTGGACSCLYRKIADEASSAEIIDYVMYIYGASENPQKPNGNARAYMNSPKFSAVGKIYTNPNARKKCGFIK